MSSIQSTNDVLLHACKYVKQNTGLQLLNNIFYQNMLTELYTMCVI